MKLKISSNEQLSYLIECNNLFNYIKNTGTFTKQKSYLLDRQYISKTDKQLMELLCNIKNIAYADILDDGIFDIGETILAFEELGEKVFMLLNTPHDTSEDIDFDSQWLTPEEEKLLTIKKN